MLSNKGNNKITELRAILQRESQNSQVYKQTKSVNNRKTVKTVMTVRGTEYLGSPPGFDGIRTVMTVRGTEYLGSPPGL
jgi:hypothetical protein